MATSDEHQFVTETFLGIARELSRSQLYGYQEAERGRLDFACMLESDHCRQVIGQTLTRHADGIEKDLNTLLFTPEYEIGVYLIAHTTRNDARIYEIIGNARRVLPSRVAQIRLLRYPGDFDADDEAQRALVHNLIKDQIVDDILLNIVFGRLSSVDISLFLEATGMPGLLLALLDAMGREEFLNVPRLCKQLNRLPKNATVHKRLESLFASGMLERLVGTGLYRLAPRATVFLRICNLLTQGGVTAELVHILERLDLKMLGESAVAYGSLDEVLAGRRDEDWKLRTLLFEIAKAREIYGAGLGNGPFVIAARTPPDGRYVDPWVGR